MYVDGQNYKRVARNLGVNHQSVCNWVKAFVERVKDSTMPVPKRKADESISEMDELFTFVTKKAKKSMSAHM